MRPTVPILTAALMALLVATMPPGLAQTNPPAPQSPTPPAATPPSGPSAAPSKATQTQPISIAAGSGMLLRLPQPAATVMSADPNVARVQPASPTSLFLMGTAPGHTTVIATTDAGAAIVQYDVTVTGGAARAATGGPAPGVSAATAMAAQAAIGQFVSGATNVHVRAAGTAMILEGTVPTAAAAQQANAIARGYVGEKGTITDEMTVLESIQVNVRVRIAEINRTVTRQLGFNWQALGKGGNWQFGVLTGAATGGVISPLLPLGLTALSGASAVPYQLGAGYSSGTRDINGVIDALAADQLITVLAEPNLTAQSGESASFLAGGEFPIPIAGNVTNGATSISVEFKQFGVSLAVVPTVLSNGRLNLRVRPEVSQLSSVGAVSEPVAGGVLTIPALTVRRAETTVELGSGQSFAIAGLLQKTSSDMTNALPGIGEVPVLGALFKSNDFQRGESELVIIVTPYIVKPTSNPVALRVPTDGFKPATDLDRILFGRQIAPTAGQPPLDAGFILK
ncbi:MAG: type II and III secretion system protein family protein [Rhodopila sp.]|nr:type II and III secretion system protein family protein [Rhodopila sp.]